MQPSLSTTLALAYVVLSKDVERDDKLLVSFNVLREVMQLLATFCSSGKIPYFDSPAPDQTKQKSILHVQQSQVINFKPEAIYHFSLFSVQHCLHKFLTYKVAHELTDLKIKRINKKNWNMCRTTLLFTL